MSARIAAVLAAAAAITPCVSGHCDPLFEPQQRVDAGQNIPVWVASADFDEDGAIDLLIGSPFPETLFLKGDGAGGFAISGRIPTRSNVTDLVVDDFNADGHADFATISLNDPFFDVYFGNGDGTFAPVQTEDAGTLVWRIAAADMNGDGVTDLVGSSPHGAACVLLSNGDGSFQPVRVVDTGDSDGLKIPLALGDFDGDGDLDVAIIAPYRGFGDDLRILINHGDATFEPFRSYFIGSEHWEIASADFDGDGNDDLAFVAGETCVRLSNGDGSFADPECVNEGGTDLLARDFDGDGSTDIATVVDFVDEVRVSFGRGDGTFGERQAFPVGDMPRMATAADFDGNGFADLAVSHSESPFEIAILLNACGCPGDLDGDGDADVEDFFLFLDWYAAGDPRADINEDGTIDIIDFFDYLDLFVLICD